jgi:serine/threonine protein kinase
MRLDDKAFIRVAALILFTRQPLSLIHKTTQHFETSKHVILAFDFMEGGDLHKHLLSRGQTAVEAALPEAEARAIFAQIMAALNYAHAHNVVHRDLKLRNILYV